MRGKRLGVIGLVVAVGTVGAVVASAAPPAGAATMAPAKVAAAGAYVVTLVTGDRVQVLDRADGTHQVSVTPGAGRAGMPFARRTGPHGQLRVVPRDAEPLLAAGRLDPRLFDVTGLIRLGYADPARTQLPLIVSYRPGAAHTAPAGATVTRNLASVNGSALREADTQAGTFWAALTGPGSAIAKVWLDGRERLLDDASNTQIGVPAAWQAGYTGKGVTVAVLDGGYDATHPDLTGVVADAKDFTGSPDGTRDDLGHGTHVAGIVAGSGAASGGKYRGVAPDARLVIGRVCGEEECDDDAILAGMEWAATVEHARVVNMSLGSSGGDGTDPLSQAIDTLTASAGTLFVVAAGNDGTDAPVSTPGVADAALSVASVGRTDALSDFSSRGPREGDFALKPDIAAPGEGIVAARAAGTSIGDPVDANYTALSGTSMATPHVTGAAAILAQEHPDWTPAQLKAALMSTAKPIDATVYGQGAGRVDVARAVNQPVRADSGSLSYPYLTWPTTGHPATGHPLTYRNDGAAPATLSLALTVTDPQGRPAPAGVFTLSAATLAVPAHGSTTVTVTDHPDVVAKGGAGSYSGRIIATAPGGVTVQTALGVSAEPESYDVSVKLVDRTGKPARDELESSVFFNLLDYHGQAGPPPDATVAGGVGRVRLPKAAYAVTGVVESPGRTAKAPADTTVAVVPKVVVDHAGITLTIDARQGHKVGALVDAAGATPFASSVDLMYFTKADDGDFWAEVSIDGDGDNLYAVPLKSDPKRFAFGYTAVLTAPGSPARTYYLAVPVVGQIPADPRFRFHDKDLYTADAHYHAQGVPAVMLDRSEFPRYLPGQTFAFGPTLSLRAPTRRTELHNGAPGVWTPMIFQQYLPGATPGFFEGQVVGPDTTYKAGGPVRQDWNEAALGPDLSVKGTFNTVSRTGDEIDVVVSSFGPSDTGHSGSPAGDLSYVTGTATLSVAGGGTATAPTPVGGDFTVPAGTGRYTLTLHALRNRPWTTLSGQVDTVWTFSSGTTRTAKPTYLPLPTVKVGGPFNGTDGARAGTRSTLDLTVGQQAGSPGTTVTSVSLEVSVDDGTTWQAVPVTGSGSARHAAVTNPAGGYVSLRVHAGNAAGATLVETILHAYQVGA